MSIRLRGGHDDPERDILADRDALERVERLAESAQHPLAKQAFESDARYLRGRIDHYERLFFDAHGIREIEQ